MNGIRLDYLSPAFYISDFLIILLILSSYKEVFLKKSVTFFLSHRFFVLFLLVLVIPLLYSFSSLALLFGILKVCEFLYVGLYVSTMVSKRDMGTLTEVFVSVAILESILAILQFVNQGSLNGVFYFVGERFYTLSSVGIAAMNTSQGLMVRPYGTFPHPNVLAFFLFMGVVFSSYAMHHAKGLRRYVFLLALLILEAGLFITFSRTVLFINVLFLLYAFGYVSLKESRRKIKNILFVIFLLIFTTLYIAFNYTRFLHLSGITQSIIPRYDLILLSLSAIASSPFFGVGLNNFYYFEALHQTDFSSIYLQPVHNIFLLVASQLGIVGLSLFLYFLWVGLVSALKSVKRNYRLFSTDEIPLVLLLSILFVGFFDHFFLTVQQGELLTALVLGLLFSKNSKRLKG